MTRARLSQPSRRKALEAGLWQKSNGEVIALCRMNDAHLINALLKSLAEGDPPASVAPLTKEVVRRNLYEAAMRVAEERSR